MKLYFRPMPGLTIVTVIALAILISLGTWQYQRLQWKTALLADVEQVADAPPFTSMYDVHRASSAEEPIDFRRIDITATLFSDDPVFFVFTPKNRATYWRPFVSVKEGGTPLFVGLLPIPDAEKSTYKPPQSDELNIRGHLRIPRKLGWMRPESSQEQNRWFSFNPLPETHNWADLVRYQPEMWVYIEVADVKDSEDIPIRRPEIRNNHFDYMLTWYGLAVVLLVIYLILHRRAGRLGRT